MLLYKYMYMCMIKPVNKVHACADWERGWFRGSECININTYDGKMNICGLEVCPL